MIDGRGHVRITDFGLAALADDVEATTCGRARRPTWRPSSCAGREVHGAQRHLRARPRALRAVHRPARVRRPHARRSCRDSTKSSRRRPCRPWSRPRPGRRARHPALPGAGPAPRPRSAIAVAARAARRRSAGGGAGRRRDAVAGDGRRGGRDRRAVGPPTANPRAESYGRSVWPRRTSSSRARSSSTAGGFSNGTRAISVRGQPSTAARTTPAHTPPASSTTLRGRTLVRPPRPPSPATASRPPRARRPAGRRPAARPRPASAERGRRADPSRGSAGSRARRPDRRRATTVEGAAAAPPRAARAAPRACAPSNARRPVNSS